MFVAIWLCAVVFAVTAGCLDWRSRRIPNWLTVSGLLLGVGGNTALFGWAGLKSALAGAGLPLFLLLPVVLLRGLGAGDWKLMGGLGALVGQHQIVKVLLATVIVAGLIAIGQMIWQRRVLVTLRNLWELLKGFFIFGLRPNPELSIDNPHSSTLPFGVAAAAATLLCFTVALAGF
jgi:prepilin peptidase CpaA